MRIRDAHAADFPAIAALTNHYILNTAIHFGTEPVSPADMTASWQKSREVYPFLVGEREADQSFIGYAKAGRWRERAAYDRTAEVGIYIRPEFQGQGHGKDLYRALIAACLARGFHTLVAGIALPNPASIRLHESVGFTHTGTFRQVGWKLSAWHDVAFYQMMLE